jgi:hypothetical protein
MLDTIYTHSVFQPEEFSHGGCKRTAQIHEILIKNSIPFNTLDFKDYNFDKKKISSYLKGILSNKRISSNFRNEIRTGNSIDIFKEELDTQKPSFFIWESVSNHYSLLSKELHNRKIPFIAVPHNIESLVKGNISFTSGKQSPNWFQEELSYLKLANKVFTISLEEQWLLSTFGIETDFLPYYPTSNTTNYLLEIRKQRELKDKVSYPKNLLLLGTFYNPPTRRGNIELIEHIASLENITINVVGFGSEILNNLNLKNVKVWGSVSNEKLKDIIIENDAVLLHQEPTSGALTKMSELLIAGIPIFANYISGRTYHNTPGVNVYFNFSELLNLLNTVKLTIPPIPKPPVEAEKRFVDTIKAILNKN